MSKYWTRVDAGLDYGEAPVIPGADRGEHEVECGEQHPDGWRCSRGKHSGRHLAGTGKDRVAAAWPGTHPPTVADLDDPTPAGVVIPTSSLPTHESDAAAREVAEMPKLVALLADPKADAAMAARPMFVDVDHATCRAETERLRGLLRKALDGWAKAAEMGPHEPGRRRNRTAIADIRRSAGLS